jgi:hypothetical protein
MKKKIMAYTKNLGWNSGEPHLLKCCLCGDINRNNLKVEDIGLGTGMTGDDFSFCKKCWEASDLGQRILNLLEYPGGIKIKDDCLDLVEYK